MLLVVFVVTFAVVVTLPLFLAAGTLVWPAGWAFLALLIGFMVAQYHWLLCYHPDFLTKRMTKIHIPDRTTWDQVFNAAVKVGFPVWLTVIPLDAMRFRWSQMPGYLGPVGAGLLLCSYALVFLTIREHVARSISIGLERVITTGPYQYVRHPPSAALSIFLVGTSLLLGSWYGLGLGLILIVLVAREAAVLKERTLRAALPGYDEYIAQVKYRIIPYIW